jgi:hydrogenase maturation protein HypF
MAAGIRLVKCSNETLWLEKSYTGFVLAIINEIKLMLNCFKINIYGIVQAVGFRPAMYRMFLEKGFKGTISNLGSFVELYVEAENLTEESIEKDILVFSPDKAKVSQIITWAVPIQQFESIQILISDGNSAKHIPVPPDLNMCEACKKEFLDKHDRRHGYYFNSCTDCGPRYTILKLLPYDREATTMDSFPLCKACLKQYNSPADRRFHAQGVGCPHCGPKVWFTSDTQQEKLTGCLAINEAKRLLKRGKIIALKGVGGYQLVCDATNQQAIEALRLRKKRPHKPFAVMARSLQFVKSVVKSSPEEIECVSSDNGPIVIFNRNERDTDLCSEIISPDSDCLGLFLPTSPLHLALFDHELNYLVVTSGNRGGQPICRTCSEAEVSLGGFVDGFIHHDREIVRVCDDSVFKKINKKVQPIRLGRGYVPTEYESRLRFDKTVLSLGGHLKSAICLGFGNRIVQSQHVGDLVSPKSIDLLKNTVNDLLELYKIKPQIIAVDFHPDLASTQLGNVLARKYGAEVVRVQHHHAHAASCMFENKLNHCIAIIFDGVGLGVDSTLWGGEAFIMQSLGDFERICSMDSFPIIGGDKAVSEPWRQALSYLIHKKMSKEEISLVLPKYASQYELFQSALSSSLGTYTSAAGRYFDVFASLLGICSDKITFEGQAAITLEQYANRGAIVKDLLPIENSDDHWSIISFCHNLLEKGSDYSIEDLSMTFHYFMAKLVTKMAVKCRKKCRYNDVVLSGGVFQNRVLTELSLDLLSKSGFQSFTHSVYPSNDANLSVGQSVVASYFE